MSASVGRLDLRCRVEALVAEVDFLGSGSGV